MQFYIIFYRFNYHMFCIIFIYIFLFFDSFHFLVFLATVRPSRAHVQTTSDSPNWRRQHSTCNDKNDPSSLSPSTPLPLCTVDCRH